MTPTFQTLLDLGRNLGRWLGGAGPARPGVDDPKAVETMTRAREARQAGHLDEARTLYRYVLQRWPHHADGLRGLRCSTYR
jgi:hypothetical protein